MNVLIVRCDFKQDDVVAMDVTPLFFSRTKWENVKGTRRDYITPRTNADMDWIATEIYDTVKEADDAGLYDLIRTWIVGRSNGDFLRISDRELIVISHDNHEVTGQSAEKVEVRKTQFKLKEVKGLVPKKPKPGK